MFFRGAIAAARSARTLHAVGGASFAAATALYAAGAFDDTATARRSVASAAAGAGAGSSVLAFGWGQYGQLGLGSQKDTPVPTPITYLNGKNVTQVSAFAKNTAVVTASGEVFTFGCGKDGRVGHGYTIEGANEDVPRRVQNLPANMKMVAVGEFHMAAVTKDSEVWTWGKTHGGRLAHAGTAGVPSPVQPFTDDEVVAVDCGTQHTAVLTSKGEVYTCGVGREGALGHGDKESRTTLTKVRGLVGKNVVHVSCGSLHTLCVTADGGCFGFGSDDDSQLARGGPRYVLEPVQIKSLEGETIVRTAAGVKHSLAVTADGRVFAWGVGASGQLGQGDKVDSSVAREVGGALKGKKAVDVAAGSDHSVVLCDDGSVFTFGAGRNGQLGRGDRLESLAAYRTLPVHVEALNDHAVKTVAAGANHTVVLAER